MTTQSSPSSPPIPGTVDFRHETLPNGLTIIAEVDPTAATSACGFFVATGARDETPGDMGVSHFLEHMMFKGTETLSAEDINSQFDAMGARNNAYTSHEITCFYAQVIPEMMPAATSLLGKMMRPALRTEEFDTEKKVILEEIAMYRDDPFWVIYERTLESHYTNHGLGHRVLGTDETVGALTPERMRDYWTDRYAADNTIVALAGDLNFERSVDLIAKECGDWPQSGTSRDLRVPQTTPTRVLIEDPSTERGYLIGLCPGPGVEDDRRYAAAIIGQVLGASDNSLLHWALVDTGIAEFAQAGYDPNIGMGTFMLYAQGDPAKLDQIQAAIVEAASTVTEQIKEADLERLRVKLAYSVTKSGERPGDRMQRLGRTWASLGKHSTLDEEIARIQSVSLDDVRSVLEAFPLTTPTLGRLVPAPVE
jgi:predicted Zn-dependent peptidase